MKTTGIFLACFVFITTAQAQKKQTFIDNPKQSIVVTEGKSIDIRIPIIKSILNPSSDFKEYMKIEKNAVHIMAVGVSFRSDGEVDTVYMSEKLAPKIQQVLKPDASTTKRIRETLKPLKTYKNQVILFPVLIFNESNAEKVANNHIMLSEFSGLWPKLREGDKKKSLVLLNPYYNGFSIVTN
uniref:hypothetical protein n=1 Tax=Pedobacter schmidteae TaxID=2201271 RepID=UPI000EB05098|nr:hypothetical protein [Pedobacter schmidteae]